MLRYQNVIWYQSASKILSPLIRIIINNRQQSPLHPKQKKTTDNTLTKTISTGQVHFEAPSKKNPRNPSPLNSNRLPPERAFLVLFFFFVFHLTFRRTNPSNSFVRPKVLRTRTPDKNSMTGLRQFFFSVIFERKNYLKKSYQGFFLPSFLQKVKIQTKSESSIIFFRESFGKGNHLLRRHRRRKYSFNLLNAVTSWIVDKVIWSQVERTDEISMFLTKK